MQKKMLSADLIFFSDLFYIFKKNKKKLLKVGLFSLFISLFFLLFQENTYQSEAIFLESKEKTSPLKDKFKDFLSDLTPDGPSSNAASQLSKTIFSSKSVTERVIETCGLQIKQKKSLLSFLKRPMETLRAELHLPLSKPETFYFEKAHYRGDEKFPFYLVFLDKHRYQVFKANGKLLGESSLGVPFTSPHLSFTLALAPKERKAFKKYGFVCLPMAKAYAKVQKKFHVQKDRKNRELFFLSYKDRDRFLAKRVLASFLNAYAAFYKEIVKRRVDMETAYLSRVQEEMTHEFQKEIDTLLTQSEKEAPLALTSKTSLQNHSRYIESLKKEISALELEETRLLLPSSSPSFSFEEKKRHIEEEIKEKVETYHAFLSTLNEEGSSFSLESVPESFKKFYPPAYFSLPEKKQEIISLLNKEITSLEKRLKILQNPSFFPDEKSISSFSAKTLKEHFFQTLEKLEKIEAELMHFSYLLHQIEKEEVEFSTLSRSLQDPLTAPLFQKAQEIALSLHDGYHLSTREKQLLEDKLQAERSFLITHLLSSIEMLQLDRALYEKRKEDLKSKWLLAIDAEKRAIQKQLTEALLEAATLLKYSSVHTILDLKTKTTAYLAKSLSEYKLIKEMEKETFDVQSKVIDEAHLPRRPQPKFFLLFSPLCAFLSSLLYFSLLFFKQFKKGFPLSAERCKFLHLPYIGHFKSSAFHTLGSLVPSDLNTLRKGLYEALKWKKPGNALVLTILTQEAVPLFLRLGELATKQNKKVLIIDFFSSVYYEAQMPPFESATPILYRNEPFEYLPIATERHQIAELLQDEQFNAKMRYFSSHYDILILHAATQLEDVIAKILTDFSDCTWVIEKELSKESLQTLSSKPLIFASYEAF